MTSFQMVKIEILENNVVELESQISVLSISAIKKAVVRKRGSAIAVTEIVLLENHLSVISVACKCVDQ